MRTAHSYPHPLQPNTEDCAPSGVKNGLPKGRPFFYACANLQEQAREHLTLASPGLAIPQK